MPKPAVPPKKIPLATMKRAVSAASSKAAAAGAGEFCAEFHLDVS